MLDEVTAACEMLLAQTFEGYHSLSEKEACGLLSGGASGPESPAPAIAPAVRLFGAAFCRLFRPHLSWGSDPMHTHIQESP